VSILLYAFTRLYRIADYPIYFFSDEAIQTTNAADLVRYHFRDAWGTFLPTYFENEFLFNISVSVYLQVLPFLLFGRLGHVAAAVDHDEVRHRPPPPRAAFGIRASVSMTNRIVVPDKRERTR